MKGRGDATPDFRVPLSLEALEVIEQAKPHARNGFLFPSVRRGMISDMTMSRLMGRMKLDARPHGFRSSFRD
jgi:integrase